MSGQWKKSGLWAALATAGVITMATAGWSALAEAKDPTVGTVTYLKGNARLASGPSGDWKMLQLNDRVRQQDRLKTEGGARLEATLKDGSKIRLGELSQLNLELFNQNRRKKKKKFHARLIIGRLWASVTQLFGNDSEFTVSTDNAVAGVRGTRFSTARSDDGATTVKVYSGKVLVSNKPIYAVEGHTKETRVQVPGPQEISKKQWEELVASGMQMIAVAANGDMAPPQDFALADPATDDWEAWNAKRDKLAGLDK